VTTDVMIDNIFTVLTI